MSSTQKPTGLMSTPRQNELLQQIKQLLGEGAQDMTLEQRLAALTPAEVERLKMHLPLLRLHTQMKRRRDPFASYAEVINKHYSGIRGADKALYVDLLEELEPTPERPAGYVAEGDQPKRNHTAEANDKSYLVNI